MSRVGDIPGVAHTAATSGIRTENLVTSLSWHQEFIMRHCATRSGRCSHFGMLCTSVHVDHLRSGRQGMLSLAVNSSAKELHSAGRGGFRRSEVDPPLQLWLWTSSKNAPLIGHWPMACWRHGPHCIDLAHLARSGTAFHPLNCPFRLHVERPLTSCSLYYYYPTVQHDVSGVLISSPGSYSDEQKGTRQSMRASAP